MQWSCKREREVSAQVAQTDRKRFKSFLHLKIRKLEGNTMHLSSYELGNLIKSSVFRNADPSSLRGSLLEDNKDHLLNQVRSDLGKQRAVNCNNKRKNKMGITRRTTCVEFRREQIRLEEELSMKEKVFRNTQIRRNGRN